MALPGRPVGGRRHVRRMDCGCVVSRSHRSGRWLVDVVCAEHRLEEQARNNGQSLTFTGVLANVVIYGFMAVALGAVALVILGVGVGLYHAILHR